jgi:hypothetical protein
MELIGKNKFKEFDNEKKGFNFSSVIVRYNGFGALRA